MALRRPAVPPPPPGEWRGWLMVVVSALAGMAFFFDRQVLAILKTTISATFTLSNSQYALLINAYLVPYTLCYLVSGRLVDRLGTRRSATAFLLLMACATLGCGLARGFGELFASRALLGIAESGISPAVILMMSAWFSPERRGLAVASSQSLNALAPVIAPPVVAWLTLAGQWRAAFFLPAVFSVFAAICWWCSDRREAVGVNVAEIRVKPPARKLTETVRMIFRHPRLRALILARIVSDPFYFFLNNWHTGFLQEHAGWSLARVGRWAWVPWIFVPLLTLASSAWSDHRAKTLREAGAARRHTLGLLALLAPAAALAPLAANHPAVLLVLLTLSIAMASCWITLSGVLASELAAEGTVATTIGVLSFLSGLASILFNQAAGALIDWLGYTWLFVLGACLHPLAAWILCRSAGEPVCPGRSADIGRLPHSWKGPWKPKGGSISTPMVRVHWCPD